MARDGTTTNLPNARPLPAGCADVDWWAKAGRSGRQLLCD